MSAKLASALLALMFVAALPLAEVRAADAAGDAADLATLRKAADAARAELDAERKRITSMLDAESSRVEAAKRDLAAAASATARAQGAVDARKVELEKLRESVARLEDETPAKEALAAGLRSLARDAGARARARVETLPPTAAFAEPRKMAASLVDLSEQAEVRDVPGVVSRVAAFESTLVTEVSRVDAHREPVRCSDGVERPARVVRLGGLGAIFETEDGSRRGILLHGPDGQGYAWRDPLDESLGREVHQAIERAFAGDPVIEMPLDPTGEIRSDRLHGEEGAIAYVEKGAVALTPIAALGLAAILVALRKWIQLALERRRTARVLPKLLAGAEMGDLAHLRASVAPGGGVLAEIALAGLRHADAGPEVAEEAMQTEAAARTPGLEGSLGTLALFGSLAPMLGLLGTVVGLITTFHAIGGKAGSDAHGLAAGIAEALIATAGGLAVAIPTVLTHHLLASRADTLLSDIERGADSVAEAIRASAAANATAPVRIPGGTPPEVAP